MRRRALLTSAGVALLLSAMPALPVASPASTPNPTRLAIYRRAAEYRARHPGLRVGQALFWAAYADGVVRSRTQALFAYSAYFDDAKVAAFARWLEQRLPDEPAL